MADGSASASTSPTGGPGFTSYASRLLSSTFTTAAEPNLFFSTYSTREHLIVAAEEDDILGQSDEGLPFHSGRPHSDGGGREGRRLSLDSDGSGTFSMSRIPGLATVSRGWKQHDGGASVLPFAAADVYQEHDSGDDDGASETSSDDRSDSDLSPPSFLSHAPLPPPTNAPTERLLVPKTLFVYPSTARQGARTTYQNSAWIVAYGSLVLFGIAWAIFQWWSSSSSTYPIPPPTHTPSLFPTLPILSLTALLSLLAGISALSYILSIRDAVRHLVAAALVGGPVVLVAVGLVCWAGSFGTEGAEQDGGWKLGVRVFGIACFVAAFVLARVGLARRKSVARTIKVLELAGTIIVAHPPLILLCLALSLFSTILTVPFLFFLASLLSERATAPIAGWLPHGALGWGLLAVLAAYLWTLAIFRGVQRVTVAGVVGAWYFERHEPTHPGPVEVTKAAFARATGPSLGTTIAAAFLLALFETLEFVLRRLRAALRSTRLPAFLHPLTCLVPLISIAASSIDVFNGWVLCYAALAGDDFITSASKVRKLLRQNGTVMLGDNLLVKLILFVTSLAWGLAAGVIAFLVASTRLEDASLAPLVALLCFVVPMWTMKLCQGIVGDAADTLFVAFNMDLEKNTTHCNKAVEAFGEPDTDSLA
ncbi:hypothetical protein RQP46_000503 [Phenoliferia psychrophenolica]